LPILYRIANKTKKIVCFKKSLKTETKFLSQIFEFSSDELMVENSMFVLLNT